MRRVVKFVLRTLLALIAVVVAAVIALAIVLRPPASLVVPHQGVSLSGVTVINPGIDRRANQSIVVEGSSIKAIREGNAPAADARYSGAYVLPGLIDMHVHNPPPPSSDLAYFFLMYLRYGVTTIRDTGN